MSETLKEFAERRLVELQRNPFEAARLADAERTFVRDILVGRKRSVHGRNLAKLAVALGSTPEEIARVMQAEAPSRDVASLSYDRKAVVVAAVPMTSSPAASTLSRDIPIRGTRSLGLIEIKGLGAGLEGLSIDGSRAVGYLPRTPGIADAADIYAIRIPGPSMVPVLDLAELRVIDPHRPVRPRDLVVVLLDVGSDGKQRATLGYLAGETSRG